MIKLRSYVTVPILSFGPQTFCFTGGHRKFCFIFCSMFHMLFLDQSLSIGSRNRGMIYILLGDFLTLFALPSIRASAFFRLFVLKTKIGRRTSSTPCLRLISWEGAFLGFETQTDLLIILV